MLVLTRKSGESVLIGDDITITVLDTRGDGVRIGIDAPRGIRIQREEIVRAVTEANVASSQETPDAEDRIRAALGLGVAAPGIPAADASGSADESSPSA